VRNGSLRERARVARNPTHPHPTYTPRTNGKVERFNQTLQRE
jgi:hypothetical protein